MYRYSTGVSIYILNTNSNNILMLVKYVSRFVENGSIVLANLPFISKWTWASLLWQSNFIGTILWFFCLCSFYFEFRSRLGNSHILACVFARIASGSFFVAHHRFIWSLQSSLRSSAFILLISVLFYLKLSF